MTRSFVKYTLLLLLWAAFTAACILAPFCAIMWPLSGKYSWTHCLVRAADRMVAALLGFSGRHMLSTEAATSPRLALLKKVLDYVEDRHCIEAAYEEGAHCLLSDKPFERR